VGGLARALETLPPKRRCTVVEPPDWAQTVAYEGGVPAHLVFVGCSFD
jgi:hypothetical protein